MDQHRVLKVKPLVLSQESGGLEDSEREITASVSQLKRLTVYNLNGSESESDVSKASTPPDDPNHQVL